MGKHSRSAFQRAEPDFPGPGALIAPDVQLPGYRVAVALDNQEQYWGGSAGGPTSLLPSGATVLGGVATLPGTQLNNQTTTVNAPQLFPDVIAKVAFDPRT